MILPFSTKLNGKPTYFVEKIQKALTDSDFFDTPEIVPYEFNFDFYKICPPKLHTIREDKKNRWKVGNKIDFFINCRQKDMFRFAPVIPVTNIQEVFMTYFSNDVIQISIDGIELHSYQQKLDFAINDGFDNWEDFFNYFYPKIKENKREFFKGKIIHWTNFKY